MTRPDPAHSAEEDVPVRHDPTLCSTGRHGCWSYCTCGWESGLYTTTTGAHQAFGEHLTRVTPPAEGGDG